MEHQHVSACCVGGAMLAQEAQHGILGKQVDGVLKT